MARVYRATFHCSYADGTLVQPSIHYQTDVPTGGDEPAAADVANGVWGNLHFWLAGNTPTTIDIHEVVVTEQVLPPDIGAQAAHGAPGEAGTLSPGDDDLPRGLVPLINIHTDTASRSARGWMFLASPGDSTFLVDGAWDPSYVASLQGFADQLDNSFDLGSLFPTHVNPVVYSRKRHKLGQEPYTFRITSALANPRPHWLRRRLSSP